MTGSHARHSQVSDGDTSEEESTPVAEPAATSKRKHHAIRTCPVSKKPEANLKRHLLSHAQKGQIVAEEVDKLVQVTIHKDRRRGPCRGRAKAGLKLKWCPMADCSTVTPYMRSHLTHFHKLKPGQLQERTVHVARDYGGSKEAARCAGQCHRPPLYIQSL